MLSAAVAPIAVPAIVVVSLLLMLVRPRGIAEAWWVTAGAVVLVALRLVSVQQAGHAIARGTDVYLFLFGMMLLSALAREHGLFDWGAAWAVRQAGGSCRRLFALVYAVGVLVTVFMSNDATAVVLTPAILAAARKAKLEPTPYVFVCALVANAASFVLPISNPANLVLFQHRLPSLAAWLAAFAVPSVLSIATTFLVLRLHFRDRMNVPFAFDRDRARLGAGGRLVIAGLAAMTAVLLTASALAVDLGLPTCLAALVITAVVSLAARQSPLKLLGEVSWSTLLLVAALFVLVGAVESQGMLGWTQAALAQASKLPGPAAAIAVGFVVGVANNVVNNLPLGLIAGATIEAAHLHGLLVNATLLGVDLGPNLSVTGSLATILWLVALRREQVEVSAWKFFRVGVVAMPAALLAALLGAIVVARFWR